MTNHPSRLLVAALSAAVMIVVAGCAPAAPAPAPAAEPEVIVVTQPAAEPEVIVVTPTPDPAAQAAPAVEEAPAEAAPAEEAPAEAAPAEEAGAEGQGIADGELGSASNPVLRNEQWQPRIDVIDSIEWALVPAGCFTMGDRDGFDEETPEHEICFEQPFYIMRTEVTNLMYGSDGTFSADDFPRNDVTWFDADAYCRSIGGRLPTEPEWEYAARGPNGFTYPFGDVFQPGFVIQAANAAGAERVGSQPDGASWVDAFDMAGNLREWTSSGWAPYPYDAEDGRENYDREAGEPRRVVRGGSFQAGEDFLRSSLRQFNEWQTSTVDIGFRCARDI